MLFYTPSGINIFQVLRHYIEDKLNYVRGPLF